MRDVVVALDGVLRKPLDGEFLDMGGRLLYASLAHEFKVIVLGSADVKRDEQFLLLNGFDKHVSVEPELSTDGPSDLERRRAQVVRLRSRGLRPEFAVVADPGHAVELYRMGIPSLLYLHPVFTSETFRPDYAGGIRSWAEIQSEVDYSRSARAWEIREEQSV